MDTAQPPPTRVLWSLRRSRTDVRCILRSGTPPVEVLVLQGDDRVLRERFASEEVALLWAEAYAGRLRALGWYETPTRVAAEDGGEEVPEGTPGAPPPGSDGDPEG